MFKSKSLSKEKKTQNSCFSKGVRLASLSLIFSFVLSSFMSLASNVKAMSIDSLDKTIFAMKEDLLCSWGMPSLNSENFYVSGNDKTNQKVYYGINPETKEPQPWWIAARTYENGNASIDPENSSHMILYSLNNLTSLGFNLSKDVVLDVSQEKKDEDTDLKSINNIYLNGYALSDARAKLKAFSSGKSLLNSSEKKMLRDSKVEVFDVKNNLIYTLDDKLYLPSVNSKLNAVSFGKEDIINLNSLQEVDINKIIPMDYLACNDKPDVNWSRSASDNNPNNACTLSKTNDKKLDSMSCYYPHGGLAPVCKINIEDVSFASFASAVNSPSLSSKNGKFEKVDPSSENYGMFLKMKAEGTVLKDTSLCVDKNVKSKIYYENAPKDSFLVVCLKNIDSSDSYTTSIPINVDGLSANGTIDVKDLDTSLIGNDQKVIAKVWIENVKDMDKTDVAIATVPKSLEFKTTDSLSVIANDAIVYSGVNNVMTDLKVSLNDEVLSSENDYSVKYFNNQNVGEGLIIVKGKGNFDGKIAIKSFKINQAIPNIVLIDKELVFDGTPKTIDEANIAMDDLLKKALKVNYIYYKDKDCKNKIFSYTLPLKKDAVKKSPVELGTYYVKAKIEETENYTAGESNVATLVIKQAQ